jgi:hypothetical protein
MVISSDLMAAASYRESRVHKSTSCHIFVEDTFTTMKDVFDDIPEELCFAEGGQTLPSISMSNAPGWEAASSGRSQQAGRPVRNTGNPNDDSTSSFREAMGMQHPPGALKMHELIDHEGTVWAVLNQHGRGNNERLLSVFSNPMDAQHYAKSQRGFQRKYDSVTDMFDHNNGRGVMQDLKTKYYAALGARRNAMAAPGTPTQRQDAKRSRIRSPPSGQSRSSATNHTNSTMSSHSFASRGDFFAEVSGASQEWTFPQHDAQEVKHIVALCPAAHLEELRTLLKILTDVDIALTQVQKWRKARNPTI